MAMNKFMHPKNIYITPPSFGQLADSFEEFRAISKTSAKGEVHIDFKDEAALKTLTICLLKRDFNLTVNLPPMQLVPTLPLRLNYVLWVEDIVAAFKLQDVVGLDIGCGASCIYPLLATRRNPNWHMFGIELNEESVKYARANILQNELDGRVQIISSTAKDDPLEALDQNTEWQRFDFTMCNPPFFKDESESIDVDVDDDCEPDTKKQRIEKQKPANNAKTGISCELTTTGGEVEFVKKIIQRSGQLRKNIAIFTTMLGHKSSLNPILQELKSHGITNYCTSEFCQGRTKRWGIAWTYRNDLPLRIVQTIGQTQPKPPHRFLPTDIDDPDLAVKKLCRILGELSESAVINNEKIKSGERFQFIAKTLAWRNQRRKRRHQARQQYSGDRSTDESKDINKVECGPEDKSEKHICCDDNQMAGSIMEAMKNSELPPVLHIGVSVQSKTVSELKAVVEITFTYLNGSSGWNGVYELVQYIQNKWSL